MYVTNIILLFKRTLIVHGVCKKGFLINTISSGKLAQNNHPLCRKTHLKNRSFTNRTLNIHRTIMPLYNVLHDGQPQPGTAHWIRAPLIHSIKTLSQMRQVFFRNALAIIFDSKTACMVGRGLPTHLYLCTRWCVTNGIMDQIRADADNLGLRAVKIQLFVQISFNQVALLRHHPGGGFTDSR